MAAPECDRFGADLSAYLDGELPDERVRQVERHMLGCAACRQAFEQIREVAGQLADLPRRHAPDGLTAAMRRAAERQVLLETPEPVPPRGATVWRLYARLSAAAALIVVCVFAGWYAHDRMQPELGRGMVEDLAVKADEEAPPAKQFARGARRAGEAEGVRADHPIGAKSTESDAALGEERSSRVGELAAAALPQPGSDQQVGPGRGVTSMEQVTATIDVLVAPESWAQNSVVLDMLAGFQTSVADRERWAAGDPSELSPVAAFKLDAGSGAVRERQSDDAGYFAYTFDQLTPTEANRIIEQIEQRAPRQVFVRYSDVGRVQPTAPAAAEFTEEPLIDALGASTATARKGTQSSAGLPIVGGRRGGRDALADQDEREVAAKPPAGQAHGGGGGDLAGRERSAGEEKRDQMRVELFAKSEPERPADAVARRSRARGGSIAQKGAPVKHPAAGRAGVPTSRPESALAEVATQPTVANPIGRARQLGVQLRQQAGQFWYQLQAPPRPATEQQTRMPQAVTLRVNVLSPPQVQTSRPVEPARDAP